MLSSQRLLTVNCHEAWVYQLGCLGCEIDIIDGLPGRYCTHWDSRMRPLPRGGNLTTLDKVLLERRSYDCVIGHNITDLLDLKTLPGPRLMVIHETLDGRILQHGLGMSPNQLRLLLPHYLKLVGGHAVAISSLKARTWGFIQDIVENCVAVHEYPRWSGEVRAGVRVSNQISSRREILLWDFHEAAFKEIPVRVVGHNPDMPGVSPSRDWNDLKSILSCHRFFIHTAHPDLEDGFNFATLEAMAAGLPILGNRNSSSPVEHGVSGFLSDDPDELRHYALLFLQNRELAGRMGEAARKKVTERFSTEKFDSQLKKSIALAQQKWNQRKLSDSYFSLVLPDENEKLQLLARSGVFLRLSDHFQELVSSMNIEEAIDDLDRIMRHLGLPTNRCIHGYHDLITLILEVSDRLISLQERRAAQSLLGAALMLD